MVKIINLNCNLEATKNVNGAFKKGKIIITTINHF